MFLRIYPSFSVPVSSPSNNTVASVINTMLFTTYCHKSRRTNARTALPDRVIHALLISSKCSSFSVSSSESVSYSSICTSMILEHLRNILIVHRLYTDNWLWYGIRSDDIDFLRESKSLFRLVGDGLNSADSRRQGPSFIFCCFTPNRPLAYWSLAL